jgi:HPt (histidine-containing phosphotransfer) domain-containing protein
MDGHLNKPIRQELLRDEIRCGTGDLPHEPACQVASPKLSPMEWDFKELMDRLGGDQEFLRELLVIFRQDARANLEKARTALEHSDFEGLSRSAHTLKGMLKNLAMGAAAETAAALEREARAGLPQRSEELLAQITNELQGILPEVEAQLAEVKS